ncbi:MAG: DUF3494 domain-containing protein [Proteobacteria bacterium]|nr:MAG: DUF3494 domain-containing protein [Pseudomonadota bacterium]
MKWPCGMISTIISQASIVMKTGASISGRLLAGTAVNLDQNVIAP